MPNHGNSNQNLKLLGAAENYFYLGWSVIPVLGDANHETPKQPAADWKLYQTRRASLKQMQSWFVNTSYTALGIVTGRISQLAVLDFDDEALAEAFAAQFPHLTETRTILSAGRGLPHYYFHIPLTVRTQSKQVNGADWLYEGRFVIAPPSVINGQAYTLQRGGKAQTLSQADVNRITAFLQQYAAAPKKVKTKVASTPVASTPSEPQPLTVADLQGWYRHQAKPGCRNDVLFRCACEARDSGWTRMETVAALADLHAQHRLPDEDELSRYREAVRTINSAFSRSARQARQYNTLDLPNTIIENLLQRGMTDAVRVIVALRQQGIYPGQWFTQDEAWALLKGHVGNCGMRSVLNRILSNNERLFEVRESYEHPSPKNPNPVATAISDSDTSITTCVEMNLSKPSKSQFGRKTKYYQMRSNTDMAHILGVRLTRTADSLSLIDIRSAKETRKAVHRAYIARRPGKYPVNWLKKRLGMSSVTLWRYNCEIPDLRVMPTFIEIPLSRDNLNLIPSEDSKGVFLQEQSGRTYPAKKEIAMRLLGQRKRVSLMRRWFNYYYIETHQPVQTARQTSKKLPEPDFRGYWAWLHSEPPVIRLQKRPNLPISRDFSDVGDEEPQSVETPLKSSQDVSSVQKVSHNPRRRFEDPDLEALVGRWQQQINAMNVAPEAHISKRTLRRLLIEHGRERIQEAITRIAGRDHVENAAGFLVVILRSEAKFRRGA